MRATHPVTCCLLTLSFALLAGECRAQQVFAPPPALQVLRPTPPIVPPMAVSNEAEKNQLDLARRQGQAEGQVLSWITQHDEGTSGETRAGALRFVYTLTAPEGSWRFVDGKLQWVDAEPSATAHLRVFVMDAGDGRFLPGLTLQAILMDSAGHHAAETALPFAWYPLLNGYGTNISVPSNNDYTLYIVMQAPEFRRHDPQNGFRYRNTVVAMIPHVALNAERLRGAYPASSMEEQNLALAKPEAEALRATMENMYQTAIEGRDMPVDDYVVSNANEYSEAYWQFEHGKLVLAMEMEQSAARNSHIEVAVLDKLTQRFVPGLHVTATLIDSKGETVGTHVEPLMWHPWLWHYGENWRIPKTGKYRVHVHFDPPPYARYGRAVGKIMSTPVDVDFDGQKLISGQK